MKLIRPWVPAALAFLLTVPGRVPAQTPTATYRVVFDATWSAATHPQDFPGFPHFSPPIGGTHDAVVHFWREGETASLGMKRMAEWGSTTPLDVEIADAVAAGNAGQVIEAPWIPVSPGTTMAEFTASVAHPLVTLVAMIAPSPDWFVGAESLNLLDGGAWADTLVVPLFPFDAGTDSGAGYTSPDNPTAPPAPVSAITAGPFTPGLALGTFTFMRQDAAAPVPSAPGAPLTIAPNPFNPLTTIRFTLDRAHTVELEIFDLKGRRLASLVAGHLQAGDHVRTWEGRDSRGRELPSGTYLVSLRGDGLHDMRSISLVR